MSKGTMSTSRRNVKKNQGKIGRHYKADVLRVIKHVKASQKNPPRPKTGTMAVSKKRSQKKSKRK